MESSYGCSLDERWARKRSGSRDRGRRNQTHQAYVFHHFAEGLAHLILGNDDAVNEIGDSLTALEPDTPENLDFYPGLGDAHKSIVAEDLDALETALERVLSWHTNEMVPMLGELSDDALVCFPAIVFLLLAHKRGLEIKKLDVLDSEYIPEALFNRAL